MKEVYVHYNIETDRAFSDRYSRPVSLVAEIEVEERVSSNQLVVTTFKVAALSVEELEQAVAEKLEEALA